ncbi:hypothetical protein [Thermosynechococcus sp. FA-CM-4201]
MDKSTSRQESTKQNSSREYFEDIIEDVTQGIAALTNENNIKEAVATVLTTTGTVLTTTGIAAAIGAGELIIPVAIATSTVPAAGLAGWLGFTTTATTVVGVPALGVIAAASLVGYSVYKGIEVAQKEAQQEKEES